MKKNIYKILTVAVRILKAIIYVLSAGHLCSCKHQENEPEANENAE